MEQKAELSPAHPASALSTRKATPEISPSAGMQPPRNSRVPRMVAVPVYLISQWSLQGPRARVSMA